MFNGVWISDEKLLIFASLISPSTMILFEKKYQTFDTVFHHQMKHLEVRQNTPLRVVFSTLFSVFHLVMKHCVSCLIYYVNDKRTHYLKFITTLKISALSVLCLIIK